jgi:hypothetical protein
MRTSRPEIAMNANPLRHALPLFALLAAAGPLQAQTDPAIRAIRESSGVSENRAAERLIEEDGQADAAADRGETPPPEAPVAIEPLPAGEVAVGAVDASSELEPAEEPDPQGDADDESLED